MDLSLLAGYPQDVISQVESLINQNKLTSYLQSRYPEKHDVSTDKGLYIYVQDIKRAFMKKGGPSHKVCYDDRIETLYKALGLHSFVSRVQGKNLKSKMRYGFHRYSRKPPWIFFI